MLKYLPDHYMEHILGLEPKPQDPAVVNRVASRLRKFDLEDLEDKNVTVELPIPDGFGSLDEELELVYSSYDTKWQTVVSLSRSEAPKLPTSFFCPAGWSYWDALKGRWTPMQQPPSSRTFVLDAETVEVSEGIWHPTCAVAMSDRGWIVWKADLNTIHEVSTIPFGLDNQIVGYNVSYDRSYLAPEYRYEATGNNFYDLMSMWITTNGMSNQQRNVFASKEGEDYDLSRPTWMDKTSTNGLASAYGFYTGKKLAKGVRDSIVSHDGLSYCKSHMEDVIRYCALDVLATQELLGYLLPAYSNARPSKVNRYGSVALGSCWVPLSAERFPSFYERVEALYLTDKVALNDLLMSAYTTFVETCSTGTVETASLDWTPALTGKSKGQPMWYRKAKADYSKYIRHSEGMGLTSQGGLSLSQRTAPLVLGVMWDGEPVKWSTEHSGFYTDRHGMIPHPTNRGQAVGNMFLKDFAKLYDSGFISVPEYVKELVEKKTASINWVSVRKRVQSIRTASPDGYPVTIPMMAPNGTVTGRATDAVWQVTANPKVNRYGTELKSMVAPFPGFSLVGADVNSQEAWLAACHGDEHLGYCGSTPFSLMTIAGSSKDKTDIHSVVARETGYSRDVTKIRIYGALYGQGIKGDSDVIRKANPNLTDSQAKLDSTKFSNVFKGGRTSDYGEPTRYEGGMASLAFTQMEKLADMRQPVTPLTKARMSQALAGVADYKPTRVNWIVQSSGVDFRDMLVLLTNLFYKKLGVDGRLVVTIHDEIRTMVRNEHITKATYALQLAHLYTRAAFIRSHGLDNIPSGIAWFSEVDVDDTCLRKDPLDPQITPTQQALPLGYTLTPSQLLANL